MLRHPEVATRSCESCKTWQYGKDGKIAKRGGHDLKRIGPPPCKTCPKESPEKAKEHEISDKNSQALELYYVTRAMSGANLSDTMRQDALVQRNFSVIDRIVRTYESEQSLFAGLAFDISPAPTPKPKSR